MKTLAELIEERAAKFASADALTNGAKAANRDLTEDEERSIDTALTEITGLDNEIRRKQSGEQRSQRLTDLRSGNGSPATRGPIPDTRTSEDRHDPVENPDPRRYSFFRALNQLIAGKQVSGYEGEIDQEIAKRSNRTPTGFFMPTNLPLAQRTGRGHEHRAFDTAAGSGFIPTTLTPTFVDTLRNRARLIQMGVTVLTGLVGQIDIPKKLGNLTAYWIGEAADTTESNVSTGQIELRSTTVGAYTDLTRKMLSQTTFDVEQMSLNDLVLTLALAIDLAGINGTGANNQPSGILNNADIPLVAMGANGLAMSWAKLVEITNRPAVENADEATLGFLTNPKVRANMKTTPKLGNTNGVSLWEGGTVDGYRAEVSNQMPSNLVKGSSGAVCSAGIFGDFSAFLIGFWSGLDITVDTISLAKSGGVRVIGLQDLGMCTRQPKALVRVADMLTQ